MADARRFEPSALQLLHRVGGEKLVRKMAALFSSNAPIRLETVRQALDADNTTPALNAAHSLKSSAGQLGAVRLQHLCDNIESACMAGDAIQARTFLQSADAELPEALEWINKWRPQE